MEQYAKLSGLRVAIDITTKCNAGCPLCTRTDLTTLSLKSELPSMSWTFNEFKTGFPIDIIPQILTFEFIPNFGDPIICADINKITKYLSDNNAQKIVFHTNGSLRSTAWWTDFAQYNNVNVVFCIEGTTQEMHELYRQKTNLQKILDNMKAFNEAGGNSIAQIILFKHNEDHIQEIMEMCVDYGTTKFRIHFSNRLDDTLRFIDSKFNVQMLSPPKLTPDAFINKFGGTYTAFTAMEYDSNIRCGWSELNMVFISIEGFVLPCCWVASEISLPKDSSVMQQPLYKKFRGEEHNIKKNRLDDVLYNSNWLHKDLVSSWTSSSPLKRCLTMCSLHTRKTNDKNRYVINVRYNHHE